MVAKTTVRVPIRHNGFRDGSRSRASPPPAHAGACARDGVSITAVYAYFPDKWAIGHELVGRIEQARAEELASLYEAFVTSDDWAAVIDGLWDRMAQFRIDTPAGVTLRLAMLGSPRLADLDRELSLLDKRLAPFQADRRTLLTSVN